MAYDEIDEDPTRKRRSRRGGDEGRRGGRGEGRIEEREGGGRNERNPFYKKLNERIYDIYTTASMRTPRYVRIYIFIGDGGGVSGKGRGGVEFLLLTPYSI